MLCILWQCNDSTSQILWLKSARNGSNGLLIPKRALTTKGRMAKVHQVLQTLFLFIFLHLQLSVKPSRIIKGNPSNDSSQHKPASPLCIRIKIRLRFAGAPLTRLTSVFVDHLRRTISLKRYSNQVSFPNENTCPWPGWLQNLRQIINISRVVRSNFVISILK